MSFIGAQIYDKSMAGSEEACLGEWRKALLGQVTGAVLEIGAGTGANLEFYPTTGVNLVLSEPDKNMRKKLQERLSKSGKTRVSIVTGSAESIDTPDESFDYVVSALVCCSVVNLELALIEIKRVLKPGGRLVFLEHVAAAEGSKRRRWQNRINPLWRLVAGNCHLNRETEAALVATGFTIESIQRESMRKAMPIVRPTIRGMAIKPALGSG